MTRAKKKSTRASRARARVLARARRQPWRNAERWAVLRQRLTDQLGMQAFLRKQRVLGCRAKQVMYFDMVQAGCLLGCSSAAARKRLQRSDARMLRVGGRWLVRRYDLLRLLPDMGIGAPGVRLTTSELARKFRGRGGRLLTVPGVRAYLKRHDLGRKVAGRWVVRDLLTVVVEAERQKMCEPALTTSGRADTTNAF